MSNTVRPYITKDEPCGPLDSIDIDSKDVALSQDNELCVQPLSSRAAFTEMAGNALCIHMAACWMMRIIGIMLIDSYQT